MSFLSRLFGGKGSRAAPTSPAEGRVTGEVDYKGFVIKAVPFKQNGQFQLAGTIEKEVGGTLKTYRFVRADRSTVVDEVTHLALAKGQLIVDEQGEALFA